MTTNEISAERRFWLEWVIGNALGSGFGLSMAFAVILVLYVFGFAMSQVEHHTIVRAVSLPIASSIIFAIYGFFLGLGQWAILNSKTPTSRSWFWLSSLSWMLSGHILNWSISTGAYPEGSVIATAIVGGLSGFVVGFLQWLVLRKMATSAGWWFGINILGYAIGYTLPIWLLLDSLYPFLNIELTQIIAAAITGLGLIRILKISKSSPSVAA